VSVASGRVTKAIEINFSFNVVDHTMNSLVLIGARLLAWILVIVITLLSVVPPWLRPETDIPHHFEHFVAFLAAGIAFGLGYDRRPILISVALLLFAATIEIVQIFVPGRHARLSDFIVDGVAAVSGAMLATLSCRAFWTKGDFPSYQQKEQKNQ
jgi:VanZ family protein